MDEPRVSTTALISAFGRAYHSAHGDPKIFDDFLADQLFTDEQRALFVDNLSRAFAFFEPEAAAGVTDQAEALAGFMRSQSLPITLSRARHVEGLFDRAIPRGVRQYGILGAGLGTFAYRRPDLRAHFRVFEMDHLSTQMARRYPLFAARHHPPQPARARAARAPPAVSSFLIISTRTRLCPHAPLSASRACRDEIVFSLSRGVHFTLGANL